MRSFVLWARSLDPFTRWHPLDSYRSQALALAEREKRTGWSWDKGTRMVYAVRPAGEAPDA